MKNVAEKLGHAIGLVIGIGLLGVTAILVAAVLKALGSGVGLW